MAGGGSFAAIVVAAGAGDRLRAGAPKALVEVGGRPLVTTAVARLVEAGATSLIVVAPPGHLEAVRDVVPAVVDVVAGGATRADSVRAGLDALEAARAPEPVVAVHDAARAHAPATTIRAAVDAVTGDVLAAAPAVPVVDTLKRVDGDTVVGTVDRDTVAAVQTPQVFVRDALRAAHEGAPSATDDLALVEVAVADGRLVGRVVVVPGAPLAHKVTWPHDVVLVEAMLAEGAPA